MAERKKTVRKKVSQKKEVNLEAKWKALQKKQAEVEAKAYDMGHSYEPLTPIVHKNLGWGYVLKNKNDRLEVLFQSGLKNLISNYHA